MTEPTIADVVARLEAIEKRLKNPEVLRVESKQIRTQLAHSSLAALGEFVTRKPFTNRFSIELDREADGRIIAEVVELPGVTEAEAEALVYGSGEVEVIDKAKALALRVLVERLENGEPTPGIGKLFRLRPTSSTSELVYHP